MAEKFSNSFRRRTLIVVGLASILGLTDVLARAAPNRAPEAPAVKSVDTIAVKTPDTAKAKTAPTAPLKTVPAGPSVSSKLNSSMDSVLKQGALVNRDEDSAAQVEADSNESGGSMEPPKSSTGNGSLTPNGTPPGPGPGASSSPPVAGHPAAKPGLPFIMKKPSKKDIAGFQAAVLKALTALEKKDYAKARMALAKSWPTERLAQVYRTVLLSKAYQGEGDLVRADSVLQACLEWVGGTVWQSYLLNRRVELFPGTHPSDSLRLVFLAHVIQAPVSVQVKVNFLYDLLRLQGFTGNPTGFMEPLRRIVSLAPADRRLDSLYHALAPNLPPGKGLWEDQNLMLELETKLSLHTQALARCEAMVKMVPGKSEKQQLHWTFATLIYSSKDFTKAIAAYNKFIERYGETPEAVLQIARSYDRLQEPKKALIWYDKYLEKYPKQDKTSEIYWLRAWDLESQGDYVEAIEFYYRELADFSGNKRGDWANFRVGVCQLKAGNLAAALQAFQAIRSQQSSNAYAAGLFWEARLREAMGDSAAAKSVFLEVHRKYPFNFYGHLARQTLTARGDWADSLEPWKRFAPSTAESVKAWMKSEMSGFREKIDNGFESEYLSMGKLLQFKLDTLAILTLKTTPDKVKSNPWYLYLYGRMFANRELWRESYRLGLQLSYRIPPDKWGMAPKEVLRLLYPRPYEGLVQKYSAKNRLDPSFVYALMRQESAFEWDIKSGAGAVGLMQLMPATGKMMAKKEKWSAFDPYALINPDVNINLGTAYLRDLKKEYNDNPYFVLSNYNAGPEPTRRWKSGSAAKPVEMVIEDINYWETRDYVKKVMGNYWTYRLLWNNRAPGARRTAVR